MNRRLIGLGLGVAAAATAFGACDMQEPQRECAVARAVSDGSTGSFATTYTLKPGQDPSRACAQLKPEPVGLQKYYGEQASAKDSVAVRTARLGTRLNALKSRLATATANQPNALGELATEAPGTDNFCDVPTLSAARLEVPARDQALPDGGTLAEPPESYAYEWSNLRIYNTPEIPGTQFVADLRYTENGCTAEYQVKGIWPVVACGTRVDGVMVPDEAKCLPNADWDAGRLRGSGINPLFPVKCDPTALICVLTGEVPSDQNP